ncbi:hypothetical protein [Streptomyces sp. NPDC001809]
MKPISGMSRKQRIGDSDAVRAYGAAAEPRAASGTTPSVKAVAESRPEADRIRGSGGVWTAGASL